MHHGIDVRSYITMGSGSIKRNQKQ